MEINEAVEYCDVVIDKDSGAVLDLRPHVLTETPQEEIERINNKIRGFEIEDKLSALLFGSMIETPGQTDATPLMIAAPRVTGTIKLAF